MQLGTMPVVVDAVKARLKHLPKNERTCVLLFDEMSIKQHLYYERSPDMVYGYANSGTERSPDVARPALLVVLSGL